MRMVILNKLLQPVKKELEEKVGGKINLGFELSDTGLYFYVAKSIARPGQKPFIVKYQKYFPNSDYNKWETIFINAIDDFEKQLLNAGL